MSKDLHLRRFQVRGAAACLLVALCAGAVVAAEPPLVRVGVVVDGPWQGNAAVRALTRVEVTTLTEGEFDVRFPDEHYLVGDWTVDTARDNLQRLLDDPRVDVVVTWGMLASHTVCCYGALPKPVIAPVMIDRKIQDVPYAGGTSGIANLTYVSLPNNLVNELDFFRRMVPFERVALLSIRGAHGGHPAPRAAHTRGRAGAGPRVRVHRRRRQRRRGTGRHLAARWTRCSRGRCSICRAPSCRR